MDKTAVITGGGGGIALAIAKSLAGRGYKLVLVDIDEARLAENAAALPAGTETLRADLTDPGDCTRIKAFIAARGDLELLVNNAGIIRPGNIVDLPFEAIERHIAINLTAPMRLTQAAAKAMLPRKRGSILSIVSAAGLVALPGSAAYSASKFGLRGYLTAAAMELEPHGIKVRGIFPGAVDTAMLRYEATHGGSPLNFLNKDVLTPEQVAEACIKALDGKRLETYLPFSDGFLSRIVCAMPGLMPKLIPMMQKQGEAGLKRFLKARGLTPAAPASDA